MKDIKKHPSPHLSATRFSLIRNSAKSKGLIFEVSIDYLWDLYVAQEGECKLSGVLIPLNRSKSQTILASLDRIDSSKGYIVGNVQWVHTDINFLKSSMDNQVFIDWCVRISNTQTKT